MSRRPPSTLHDLCELYGGGHMLVSCPRCGRQRIFAVHEIRAHWKKKRWSDRWRDLPDHLRCALCWVRPRPPMWIEDVREITAGAERACLAPYGINPRAWALAAPADREKLIKARR